MLDWLEVPLELPSYVELLYPSTTPRTAPSKLWIIAQQSILMVAVLPKSGRIRLYYRFLKKRSCSERPVVTQVVTQKRPGRRGKENGFLLPGLEPRLLGRPAHSPYRLSYPGSSVRRVLSPLHV
jgi:hypothetical protein